MRPPALAARMPSPHSRGAFLPGDHTARVSCSWRIRTRPAECPASAAIRVSARMLCLAEQQLVRRAAKSKRQVDHGEAEQRAPSMPGRRPSAARTRGSRWRPPPRSRSSAVRRRRRRRASAARAAACKRSICRFASRSPAPRGALARGPARSRPQPEASLPRSATPPLRVAPRSRLCQPEGRDGDPGTDVAGDPDRDIRAGRADRARPAVYDQLPQPLPPSGEVSAPYRSPRASRTPVAAEGLVMLATHATSNHSDTAYHPTNM